MYDNSSDGNASHIARKWIRADPSAHKTQAAGCIDSVCYGRVQFASYRSAQPYTDIEMRRKRIVLAVAIVSLVIGAGIAAFFWVRGQAWDAIGQAIATNIAESPGVSTVIARGSHGVYEATVDLNANTAATNVQITKFTLGTTSATGLPIRVGSIPIGTTKTIVIPLPGYRRKSPESRTELVDWEISYHGPSGPHRFGMKWETFVPR